MFADTISGSTEAIEMNMGIAISCLKQIVLGHAQLIGHRVFKHCKAHSIQRNHP
jgi:hypothetical protein